MSTNLRKPLTSISGDGSRLPIPGISRLRPPTQLKAPATQLKAPPSQLKAPSLCAAKRSRSPDEAPSAKRKRVEQVASNTNLGATIRPGRSLKPSSSTGRLDSKNSANTTLRSSTSGSRIGAKNTAAVKPSATKPSLSRSVGPGRPNSKAASVASRAPASQVPPAPAAGKKRPGWDVKGRLLDMEELVLSYSQERAGLQDQLQNTNDRIAQLERANNQLSGTVAQKEETASTTYKENESLRRQISETEDELHSLKRKLERETESFEHTKSMLRRQKETLEGEISAFQQEISGLKTAVAQLTSAQAGLNAELEATKLSLSQALDREREQGRQIADRNNTIKCQEETIKELNQKVREHETTRRKLHNTIQELKGNIRVFCRVRPLIGDELYGSDGEINHMNFPDTDEKILELEKFGEISMSESCISATRRANNKYEFAFDRVFNPRSSQGDVFEEIEQLVQSALDGYNVCIFAYGQTGSGKTYTMEGPSVTNDDNRGMIPRAVLKIFETKTELEDKGWQYQFEASFLEIYNETIRDLLGNGKDNVKHEIKLTGKGSHDVSVTNLTVIQVTNETQVSDLLATASRNRAVGETLLNERSSRSHSVFRLKLTGENEITREKCCGTLNLVDLAGSERLKDSGATGQRLKETQNINKSLANLGNVIMALGNKDPHVPYRDSKLTYMLQNSLGGNSKTLMFVNVSPREEHFGETLNSLRFATKVNQCNIGTATKKSK